MQEDSMWGIRVTEGVVAVLFGIAAVFWPGLTIVTLLYLFAAFILASGLIHLFTGIFHFGQGVGVWFLRVLLAFVEIGIGVYLLRHPHVTFAAFILLVGFAFIIRGVFEIVAGFVDDLSAGGRTALILVGALGLLAGIIVLFQPVAGGVAFVWVLGLYALIAGVMTIASAVSDHNATRKLATKK
jgi:uncharacterized membrane protein HdeD (DUF308 family)